MITHPNKALLLILLLLALTTVGCTGETDTQPTTDEAAAIYAAVVRQIYTVDDTYGGTLQPSHLYLIGTTDDTAGDPDSQQATPTLIGAEVRDAIAARLTDLPTELIWVETQDDVSIDPATGSLADGGAVITLGNINPEGDAVHVPSSIYVANLAAGGQTYILEQIDGTWTITGTTGVQWIS